MFYDDLVIENLKFSLIALPSEAFHKVVIGCNAILVLLGLEGGGRDYIGFAMVGGQYVLVTAASSDGEASIIVCVKLGHGFFPNVHSV